MGDFSEELSARIAAIPVHAVGEILAPAGGRSYRVNVEGDALDATRAASCLLEPEPGDRVLVAGSTVDGAYIIAVLERRNESPTRIGFQGATQITVSGGGLNVSADEGLTLHAKHGTAVIDRVSVFGREWVASIGSVKLIGNLLESFVDRLTQFARHSLRVVEGTEQVRGGIMDYRAQQSMSLRGREIVATAEELVKVDGGQIHIG
jgi:uncharacterized protein DUF3540